MSYFKCPGCDKFTETKVINCRKAVNLNGFRRRRVCEGCGFRYSTVEIIVEEGKRGYPGTKPLYFEEDYHHVEGTEIGSSSSSRYEHRVRNR